MLLSIWVRRRGVPWACMLGSRCPLCCKRFLPDLRVPWGVPHRRDTGEGPGRPRTLRRASGRVADVSRGQGGAPLVPDPMQFPPGDGSCQKNSFSVLNQKTDFWTRSLQPEKDLLGELLHASPGPAGPPRARRRPRPCFWSPTRCPHARGLPFGHARDPGRSRSVCVAGGHTRTRSLAPPPASCWSSIAIGRARLGASVMCPVSSLPSSQSEEKDVPSHVWNQGATSVERNR